MSMVKGRGGPQACLGRVITGAWGGRVPGAEGCLGRKGAWGAREPGAPGSLGRFQGSLIGPEGRPQEGVWGGRVSAAEGCLRRKGVWGGREPGAGVLCLTLRGWAAASGWSARLL